MKKILLTFLIIFSISFSSFSQEWTELFSNDNIIIETTEVECNPHNKQYPFTYLLVKYTNKTSEPLDFFFEFEIWQNDVKIVKTPADASDEPIKKHISLESNEVREGSCNEKSEVYKIFYKANHPSVENKVTKIQIKQLIK